jgi:hypothetical protein
VNASSVLHAAQPFDARDLGSAVEFAVGIAAPGSFAKVYGADNTTLGFHDIHRAVTMAASGLEDVAAYTVLPDADVGPDIDIDLPRELDGVVQSTVKEILARGGGVQAVFEGDELQAALKGFEPAITVQLWMLEQVRVLYHRITDGLGARAAILPSGRGAHLLIVGLAPAGRLELLGRVAALQDELLLKLTAAGLPDTEAAFEVTSYCRPPASPHRLEGDLGIVLYPMPGIDAAPQHALLAVLAARGRQRIEQGLLAPAFSPRLNELLREGRLFGEHFDVFLRVAARHGLDLPNVEQVIEPQSYRGQPAGSDWHIERRWREAQEAVAKIDLALGPIRAAVEAYDWNCRTGATDRRGLLAFIQIAEEEAWLTVWPGHRRLAEVLACGVWAVVRLIKRLRDRGWIRRCRSATQVVAYRVQLPRKPALHQPLPALPQLLSPLHSPHGGENGAFWAKSPTHVIWRAFPEHAADVLEKVKERPQTTLAIASAVSLSRRRTLKILRVLEPAGLVISKRGQTDGGRPAGMWILSPLTLDEAAAKLGVAAAIKERRTALKADHARDREKLLERKMGPQPLMPSLAEIPDRR